MSNNTNTPPSQTTDCPEIAVPIEIFLVIGFLSLSENLLVVVAVIRSKNLHSRMYCFICNLAVFNTISSLSKTWENIMIVFRDAGHLNSRGASELRIDNVMDTLLCMSFVGSIFSFLAIAADRYITIFHALRYHTLMTMRRTVAILVTIWTLCSVSGYLMIGFFEAAAVNIFFIVVFFTALFFILLLYVHMFLLARYHASRIASMPGNAGHQRKSGLKGALTLTILLGVFVVSWAPFCFHLLIIMVCPENPYCECYRSLFQLHVLLLMSHAVIDPAIYAFRSAELRSTFRKMFFCSDQTGQCGIANALQRPQACHSA
ncbi:adrenocorticotropic hormone receptor [Astyanax mexicanus]|uniref:Melanocyte-stimulating hormone receptor n=1 Tax=Astyanax mexicanus TaxID=7994 RepID=A0A8T2M083_ASTMX|nr:adrenocorticotropic hormone receptor [Astyanax mexicanus]